MRALTRLEKKEEDEDEEEEEEEEAEEEEEEEDEEENEKECKTWTSLWERRRAAALTDRDSLARRTGTGQGHCPQPRLWPPRNVGKWRPARRRRRPS